MSVSYTFREKTKRWTMGALAVFLPIVLYAIGIKYLFDRFYWGKSKIKKRVFFILLVTLPFWDHIAGYAYFKYLCFTQGGVKIYKTVTDLQEQKDYWLRSFNQKRAPSIAGERYGLTGHIFLTKDLKEHKIVYSNNCKSMKWKTYDCEKANEYIIQNNIKIYEVIPFDPTIIKSIDIDNNKSKLEAIRVIDNNRIIPAYFNYCNNKYDNLTKNDKNYKNSCKNTKEIIKKYDLKNVIKVPKSPYRSYMSVFDESYNHRISNVFRMDLSIDKIYNKKTNEVLAINKEYSYGGGWYVNTISPYEFRGSTCSKKIWRRELVIPNPYKQNKQIKGK